MEKQMNKKPTNVAVAVYLAEKHREHMKSDDDFKKVASLYNMKWRVLKKNFDEICKINDMVDEADREIKRNREMNKV